MELKATWQTFMHGTYFIWINQQSMSQQNKNIDHKYVMKNASIYVHCHRSSYQFPKFFVVVWFMTCLFELCVWKTKLIMKNLV